jgi:hypothetical protein
MPISVSPKDMIDCVPTILNRGLPIIASAKQLTVRPAPSGLRLPVVEVLKKVAYHA